MRAVEANPSIPSGTSKSFGRVGGRGGLRCRFPCSRSPHDKAVVARRAHLKPITASILLGPASFPHRGREEGRKRCKDVSAVVHELWVGGGHFCGHGVGGRAGLSPGRVTLALAACGACLGWAWDDRGDFLDSQVCRW